MLLILGSTILGSGSLEVVLWKDLVLDAQIPQVFEGLRPWDLEASRL